jgi:hypothetical protein
MRTTEEVYRVYFNPEMDAVIMEWKGYATTSQFRKGTELMLDTLIRHECGKVLADIRHMTLIAMEDQNWLEHNFLPRAIRAGFKKIAMITPTSYFNKIAVENVSYKIDKEKLRIHFFDSPEQGIAWLKERS